MLDESDVRQICLALPGVVETISWRRPAWMARTLMARIYDDETLTVKSPEAAALVASRPETFRVHPHARGDDGKVLVVLGRIDRDELVELLTDSYRLAGGRSG